MGYRSQVAGIISVNQVRKEDDKGSHYYDYDKAKFKEMIGFIKLTKFYEAWNTTDDDRNCFGWKDGAFIFYGDSFKWYSDYPDVKAWYEMWENLQSIEGISGYFVRVGEEQGDIEQEEFGADPCYDHFHPFSALNFSGEDFLGKRDTDEEEQTNEAQTDTQAV